MPVKVTESPKLMNKFEQPKLQPSPQFVVNPQIEEASYRCSSCGGLSVGKTSVSMHEGEQLIKCENKSKHCGVVLHSFVRFNKVKPVEIISNIASNSQTQKNEPSVVPSVAKLVEVKTVETKPATIITVPAEKKG